MRKRISDQIRAFYGNRRGNFGVIFALTAFAMVGVFGIGIDYWFALNDKTRADAAADAAGLAALNTAKAFYSANSGSLANSALVNQAIAAGQAQGGKVFTLNLGSSDAASTTTASVAVTYSNLQFTATVAYSGYATAFFSNLFGVKSFAITGSSVSVGGLPKYLDFYIVTDLSGSMGIPTNATDQTTLMTVNPDGNTSTVQTYDQSGGQGCQFACHYPGYTSFTYTQTHNLPLKLNDVGNAIAALLTTATNTEVIANQFRIGIYGFIDDGAQLAKLSSSFTNATTVANSLANYIDNGTSNNGMGAGGTHFETLWGDLSNYFASPGNGTSSSSTLPFIVLVTDGADNSQTYYPQNSFTGSWPQLPDTTDVNGFCGKAKAAGYTVAVLLIPYDPIIKPVDIWNDEDGAVNYVIDPTKYPVPDVSPIPNVPVGDNLSVNMQSCASPGYFFSAATSAQINAAMQTIFYQAVQSTRMTQ